MIPSANINYANILLHLKDKSKMKYLLIPISIILLLSCTEHHRKKQIGQLFSTEIILPDTSSLFNKALDSINLNIPAKMVVYFDAETCASCALSRIWEWDEVSHITQASNGKYQTLFIFTPKQKDLSTVKRVFQGMHMENKLVYIDDRQDFITNNPTIPEDAMFHTFLLDRKNKIVLVGNPVHNEKLWELYKNTIDQLIKNEGVLNRE